MALPLSIGAGDGAALEERLDRLTLRAVRQAGAEDWDGATSVVREMAALDPEHPKVYIAAVQLHARNGRLAEATAFIDTLGSESGPGRLYGTGMLLVMGRRTSEAQSRFDEALELYRSMNHYAGRAAANNGLGLTARGLGRFDEAVERYESALASLEEIPDRKSIVGVLTNLADVEARRGLPARALERYRSLLSLREQMGDRPGQALTWNGIGTTLVRLEDRDGAVDAHRRALELFEQLNDLPARVSTLQLMIFTHATFDEWEPAVMRFREALSLAGGSPDRALGARVHRTLGDAYLSRGRYREATEPLETAAAIYHELGRRREEAEAVVLIGTALNELGEFRRTRQILSAVVETAREFGDRSLEAGALINLANADRALGETSRALTRQERALLLHRQTGNRLAEQRSLNNLGVIYFYLGNYERAGHYFEQALSVAERLADTSAAALAQNNLGAILVEQGRLEPALEKMRRCIKAREELGDTRGAALGRANVAEALLQQGRLAEAAAEVEKAFALYDEADDRPGRSLALNLRGEVLSRTGKPKGAAEAHRRALEIALEVGLVEEQWQAHAGLAIALAALGQREAALDEARQAIDDVELARARLETGELRMRFLARKIDLYEQALAILDADDGEPPSARAAAIGFELSERARARSLLDLLAESRSELRTRLDPKLAHRERETLDLVNAAAIRVSAAGDSTTRDAARLELAEAETRLERLEIEIRRADPRYGEIVYPDPVTVVEVRSRVLRDDEAVLEYFIGKERAWLWVVDRSGVKMHPLPAPAEIRALVENFLNEASRLRVDLGGSSRDVAAAARLSAALLPAGVLPAAHRLLVVPDGPLHHVPFEALRMNGRFLIENHEIAVVTSATGLRLMREHPLPVAPGGFFGVGGPVSGGDENDLPPLPYSRAEVEKIAELFPETARLVLTGPQATKSKLDSIDLSGFRYLHLATHARLESGNPRLNGLIMTAVPEQAASGTLTLGDILGLQLGSEVAVLSACSSGLGEQLRGEGLVSLTRAFLYAGSRAVVVSLWDVGDRSTLDFMGELYEALLDGSSVSSALRQAKLSFLTSDRPGRRDIFRWAPFVVIGDPGAPAKELNRTAAASTKVVY